jgi:hypothetical protein
MLPQDNPDPLIFHEAASLDGRVNQSRAMQPWTKGLELYDTYPMPTGSRRLDAMVLAIVEPWKERHVSIRVFKANVLCNRCPFYGIVGQVPEARARWVTPRLDRSVGLSGCWSSVSKTVFSASEMAFSRSDKYSNRSKRACWLVLRLERYFGLSGYLSFVSTTALSILSEMVFSRSDKSPS